MTRQRYTLHITAMSSIFVLGNIINPTATNFADVFIMCFLAFAGIFVVSLLLKSGKKNKAIYLATDLLLCVVAIYVAITTFLDYVNCLSVEQMPQNSKFLLAFVLFATLAIFSLSKEESIYKYCLFTFAIIISIIAVCFISGVGGYNYKNIDQNCFKTLFLPKQFVKSLLSAMILTLFSYENTRQYKTTVYGIVVGIVCLFLVTLQTVLTFGANCKAVFPYLKAISTISLGSLFTRVDGAVWFIFFVCAVIKITVCVKTVFIIAKKQQTKKAPR